MSDPSKIPLAVLCVDDDESTLLFLRRYLKMSGYRVLTANDGLAGLALLRCNRVDIVVLDHDMPGMNGSTLAREIRRVYPALPIVEFTGALLEDAEVSLVDACIPKGESPTILLYALEALLSGLGSGGES